MHVWQSPSDAGWGEGEFTKDVFFARNCITCPELYRKVMFANPFPMGCDQFQNQFCDS